MLGIRWYRELSPFEAQLVLLPAFDAALSSAQAEPQHRKAHQLATPNPIDIAFPLLTISKRLIDPPNYPLKCAPYCCPERFVARCEPKYLSFRWRIEPKGVDHRSQCAL
jgi:hypothetical protein